MDIIHEHGVENLCIEIHGTYGQGADGFPMVGLRQAHEPGPFGMSRLVLILESHLQCRFHGRRSIIVEREFRESLRQERFQFPAQFDGRLMGEICENHVFQLVHLFLQGLVDFRIAVAQKVAPPGRNDIQIRLAMGIVQVDPLPMVHHHRWKYFIILHLHGRMPDIFFIFRFPINCRHAFLL